MSKLTFEHFDIHPTSLQDICDCCMNHQEFQHHYNEYIARSPKENLFRILYQYGFLNSDDEWVSHYNKIGDTIYLMFDFTRLIEHHAELLDLMPTVLNHASLLVWNEFCDGI